MEKQQQADFYRQKSETRETGESFFVEEEKRPQFYKEVIREESSRTPEQDEDLEKVRGDIKKMVSRRDFLKKIIPSGADSDTELKKKQEGGEMSRRSFIKKTMGFIASFTSLKLLSGKKAHADISVATDKKETKEMSIADQIIIPENKELNRNLNLAVTPEYARQMERLLLTFPSKEEIEEMGFDEDGYIEQVYRSLLLKIPEYTEIDALLKEKDIEKVKSLFQKLKIKNRINFLPVKNEQNDLEIWAQDVGEIVKVDGEEKFVVSMDLEKDNLSTEAKNTGRIKDRIAAISEMFGKEHILQADFHYEGGNLTFDETESGGLRVFVGYNTIALTQGNYSAKGEKITEREVAEKISKTFGGAEVVVMGNDVQESPFGHIDQSFTILDDKKAVVNQLSAKNVEASWQHKYYKKQLEALGYEVITIDNSVKDFANCYASTNAVPFVDKITKEKKIIFPIFPGEISKGNEHVVLSKEKLQGKGLEAYRAYEKAGYVPMPVRDTVTHLSHGNTHCITNVLANRIDGKKEEMIA